MIAAKPVLYGKIKHTVLLSNVKYLNVTDVTSKGHRPTSQSLAEWQMTFFARIHFLSCLPAYAACFPSFEPLTQKTVNVTCDC